MFILEVGQALAPIPCRLNYPTAYVSEETVGKILATIFNLITEVTPPTTFASFARWKQTIQIQPTFKGSIDYKESID